MAGRTWAEVRPETGEGGGTGSWLVLMMWPPQWTRPGVDGELGRRCDGGWGMHRGCGEGRRLEGEGAGEGRGRRRVVTSVYFFSAECVRQAGVVVCQVVHYVVFVSMNTRFRLYIYAKNFLQRWPSRHFHNNSRKCAIIISAKTSI